jgi:hypothetical protein
MKTPGERLLDVAKRLDDMAGEDASELTTLSEELGLIEEAYAEMIGVPRTVPPERMPRWLQEFRRMIEQTALEIVGERYAERGMGDPRDPYMIIRVPNRDYGNRYRDITYERFATQAMMSAQTLNPMDAIKITGNVV